MEALIRIAKWVAMISAIVTVVGGLVLAPGYIASLSDGLSEVNASTYQWGSGVGDTAVVPANEGREAVLPLFFHRLQPVFMVVGAVLAGRIAFIVIRLALKALQ